MEKDDNGKSRLLYRLVMTRKLAGIGKEMLRVSDHLDSDFQRIDPKVVERAAEIRNTIDKILHDLDENDAIIK